MNARALQRLNPRGEIVTGAATDGWIAPTNHKQIAAQHTVVDRTGRAERRGEPVIPSDCGGRCRDAYELCHRGGHHQGLSIDIEEALVASERLHRDAPRGALDAGHFRDRDEIVSKFAELVDWGRGRCDNGRRRFGTSGRDEKPDEEKARSAT